MKPRVTENVHKFEHICHSDLGISLSINTMHICIKI